MINVRELKKLIDGMPDDAEVPIFITDEFDVCLHVNVWAITTPGESPDGVVEPAGIYIELD